MTPQEVHQDQLHLKQKKDQKNKKTNALVKAGEIKRSLFSKQPMFVYKEACLSLTNLEPVQPSKTNFLLQGYKDVLFEDSLEGKPPNLQLDQSVHKETRPDARSTITNKNQRDVIFEVGEQVWVHLRKEPFPKDRKSQLIPGIEGPFTIIKRINHDTYQLDFQGKYNLSSSFNNANLLPFHADSSDLRTNPFEEGGVDVILPSPDGKEGRTDARRDVRPDQPHDHALDPVLDQIDGFFDQMDGFLDQRPDQQADPTSDPRLDQTATPTIDHAQDPDDQDADLWKAPVEPMTRARIRRLVDVIEDPLKTIQTTTRYGPRTTTNLLNRTNRDR